VSMQPDLLCFLLPLPRIMKIFLESPPTLMYKIISNICLALEKNTSIEEASISRTNIMMDWVDISKTLLDST